MYICIYVYMYICIYVYMYICIYEFLNRFEHERVNFISPSAHVLFCLLYKHRTASTKNDNRIIDTCENYRKFSHVPKRDFSVAENLYIYIYTDLRMLPEPTKDTIPRGSQRIHSPDSVNMIKSS